MLLDEIEKAHPDIFNILLQVMDHATLTDNNGRKADFRQVVLIMTSNAGSREMSAGSIGFSDRRRRARPRHRDSARRRPARKPAIERVFSPEFRNRLDAIVTFGPLTPDVMETIVDKFIIQLEEQLAERRIAITLQPDGAGASSPTKGYDPIFGARPLARVIQTEVRDRADRRDPVRRARERRHRRDRLRRRDAAVHVRGEAAATQRNRFLTAGRSPRGCSATEPSEGARRSGAGIGAPASDGDGGSAGRSPPRLQRDRAQRGSPPERRGDWGPR